MKTENQLLREALDAAKLLIHQSIMRFPENDTPKKYEEALSALDSFKASDQPETVIKTQPD